MFKSLFKKTDKYVSTIGSPEGYINASYNYLLSVLGEPEIEKQSGYPDMHVWKRELFNGDAFAIYNLGLRNDKPAKFTTNWVRKTYSNNASMILKIILEKQDLHLLLVFIFTGYRISNENK